MNRKIITRNENRIVLENENIEYEFNFSGFKLTFKTPGTKEKIIGWLNDFNNYYKYKKSNIDIKKWENLYNGVNNDFIPMESFEWFNTWVVTKSTKWKRGSDFANKISKELFGIDKNNMDRIAGTENNEEIIYSSKQIFEIISENIVDKFKNNL